MPCILKQVRMPQSVYNKVKEVLVPMHIPKPVVLGDVNLHYITFAEAQILPFIAGDYQPSLIVKSDERIVAAANQEEGS